MKFFFSIILLIICQYFLNQIIIDARPAKVKKFSWALPIHTDHDEDGTQQLVKRKGAGWGKRNAFWINDHPYAVDENAAGLWLDDK